MPPEPLSYEEWFKMNRFYMSVGTFEAAQSEEFARRLTELFVSTTAERLTEERVEYFCSGVLSLCDFLFEEAARLPDEAFDNDFLRPCQRHILAQQHIGAVVRRIAFDLLPRKRSLAKSPIFYRMVCRLIGDARFGVARFSVLRYLLGKTGRNDGIDFAALLQDPDFYGSCFTALRRLKDGRFVREAEVALANVPDDDPETRQTIRRYLDLFAAPQD